MSNGFVETDTVYGRVRGVRFRHVDCYLGLAYGASTAGEGRFAPPRIPRSWDGVRDAFAFGDASPQLDTRTVSGDASAEVHNLMYVKGGHPLDGARMSEDCLNLNVWTPSSRDGGGRPVMVWLHGGGFVHGSAGSALYSGDQLAALGDVVVVTVNARLGIHGYLPLDLVDSADSSFAGSFAGAANAGMLDIVAALEWVRDNIAGFGGDPGNVTVFGQSGGGGKVNTLMVMPRARGLFHKAINMSGPILALRSAEEGAAFAERALAEAGLGHGPRALEWMRELTTWELLQLQGRIGSPLGGAFGMGDAPAGDARGGGDAAGGGDAMAMAYGPTVDGADVVRHPFVPDAAPWAAEIPMLVGSASHDPALLMAGSPEFATLGDERARALARIHFGDAGAERYQALAEHGPDEAPRLRYARLVGDVTFRGAALAIAAAKAAQPAPVYVYEFAHPTDILGGLIGAAHSLDLPFVFYNVDRSPFAGSLASRHETSRRMALAWAAFARTGDPNHAEIPEWPRFGAEHRDVMRIAPEFEAFQQPALD